MECSIEAFVFTGYDDFVPKDDDYLVANVTSAADSNGTATHTSGDVTNHSPATPLTRKQKRNLRDKLRQARQKREKAEQQKELTKNAMHDDPMDSGHSDPNRTTNDTPGIDTDGLAARSSSHVPTVLSSTDLPSTDPSSTPFNPATKRRTRSSSPQARAAKRQKEMAENAMFDGPVPDSNSNHLTNDAPGAGSDAAVACLSGHASTPSSAPLTRMQKRKLRSRIRRAAKRYKEKQIRLAKEAMSGSPLTECNQSDPNPTTNDAPGIDNNSAPACLSGDASISSSDENSDALHVAGLHGMGLSNEEQTGKLPC